MVSEKMDERRNNSPLCTSGEGVVLLQRGDHKTQVRKNDKGGNEKRSTSSSPKRVGSKSSGELASISIEGLTNGELILIKRRRAKLSQKEIASRAGITRNLYGAIERDQKNLSFGPNSKEIEELSQAEICFILRRRSGLSQKECADKLGVSRFWFNQMETEKVSCSKLVKFWS